MNEKVRLHVHWGMKVIAVFAIIVFPCFALYFWQIGNGFFAFIYIIIALLGVWLFFLAATKIDVDQNGIQATVYHGVYAMRWEEVVYVEKNRYSTYFISENKAIGYNLLLAGKGKREFKEYNKQIINQWQFKPGRPAGVSNSTLRKMMKRSKVRGWKLF